ncbi:hypothetical protein ACVW00_002358 [Marmoricola sp. URHA0025 HA25]
MRRVACLLVVTLGLAALWTPVAATPSFVASQPVSTGSLSTEMHAAIGSGGVVAVVFMTADYAVRVSVRRPGTAWAQGIEVSPADATSPYDMDATVAQDGSLTVAWRRLNTVFARSMSSSGVWSPVVPLSEGVQTPFHAVVAGNDNGDVAVAWQEGFTSKVLLRVRRGGSWSSIVTVSSQAGTPNTAGSAPEVVVDPLGGVVVEYLQQNGSTAEWWSMLRELPPGSTTLGAVQDPSANPVTPPTSLDRYGPVRIAGDSQGHVALAIRDATGAVWEDYWDRVDPPEGAISNSHGSEAVPGFFGRGRPYVAVLEGSVGSRDVVVYDRDDSSIWPTSTPVWTGADVDQLSTAWDEHGRVLLAMKETATAPGPYVSTIVREGGVWGGTVRQHDHAFDVWDAAMNPAGDGLVAWYSILAPATIWAAPFDASGPSATLDGLPTWSLAAIAPLHWTALDTWSTTVTSTVRRTGSPGGAWSDVLTTSGSSTSQQLARGTTACFAVRATDPSANTGAWSATQCTAAPLDDRSLSGKKRWRKLNGSGFYAGTALKSTAQGRVLTYSATGKQLALVASRCGACGAVKVLVNGVLVRRVSLKGAAANRVVFAIKAYPSARALKVKVVTTSGKKVVIDGLGISQS